MKKLGILATATLLALTACGTNDATADETEAPTLDSIEALNAHAAERYNGGAELHAGNLTITIETRGTTLLDQDTTLKALEDANAATIDYDTVTITAPGTFGCRYDTEAVEQAAAGIVVTTVWDHAETCTGTN